MINLVEGLCEYVLLSSVRLYDPLKEYRSLCLMRYAIEDSGIGSMKLEFVNNTRSG